MPAAKLRLLSSVLAFSLLAGAGFSALADGVEVVVPSPYFYPRADFQTEHGYFRTDDGHYYHYDRDRDGWHNGRNHREGMRMDRHREHK